MENRLHLVIFLVVILLVFLSLWSILGERPTKQGVIVMVNEDESLFLDDTTIKTRKTQSSFNTAYDGSSNSSGSNESNVSNMGISSGTSYFSNDEETTANDYASLDFGFNMKFIDRIKKPKRLSLEERKNNLRKELEKQGISNQDYIDMMVLELEEEEIAEFQEESQRYLNENNPSAAMQALFKALDKVHPKNLLVKANLYAQINAIATNFAYPEEMLKATAQVQNLQRQILEIQLNTPQIMANSETKEQLQAQLDLANSPGAMIDYTKNFVDYLSENKGLSTEVKQIRNATFLNLEKESSGSDGLNAKDLIRHAEEQDKWIEEAWSNPKNLR